jgi:phosphoglycolate phosphatase-like HAD superfamily hydrolase
MKKIVAITCIAMLASGPLFADTLNSLDPLGVESDSVQGHLEGFRGEFQRFSNKVFEEAEDFKGELYKVKEHQFKADKKDLIHDYELRIAASERGVMRKQIVLLEERGEEQRVINGLLADGVKKSLAHVSREEKANERWAGIYWGVCSTLAGAFVLAALKIFGLWSRFISLIFFWKKGEDKNGRYAERDS